MWLSADSLVCYFVYFYGNYSNFNKIEQLFKAPLSLCLFLSLSRPCYILFVFFPFTPKAKLKLTLLLHVCMYMYVCANLNLEHALLFPLSTPPLLFDHVSLISRSLVALVFYLAILLLYGYP